MIISRIVSLCILYLIISLYVMINIVYLLVNVLIGYVKEFIRYHSISILLSMGKQTFNLVSSKTTSYIYVDIYLIYVVQNYYVYLQTGYATRINYFRATIVTTLTRIQEDLRKVRSPYELLESPGTENYQRMRNQSSARLRPGIDINDTEYQDLSHV